MRTGLIGSGPSPRMFLFSWRSIACLAIALALLLLIWPLAAPAAPVRQSPRVDPTLYRSENCVICHKPQEGFSHPTGMYPTFDTPDSLPLIQGKVGCTTCHDPGKTPDLAHPDAGHEAKLRGPRIAGEFCRNCHQNTTAESMHRLSGRAHLRWINRSAIAVNVDSEMDGESQSCLTCHDGSIAKDVSRKDSSFDTHDRGHPIGTRYVDRGIGRNNFIPLTPAQTLDPRIRLFKDTIGCGSCHSPYSHENKFLVMPNDRSSLCMSCHKM